MDCTILMASVILFLVGSRRQVLNGTAYKTGYGKAGLTKGPAFSQ